MVCASALSFRDGKICAIQEPSIIIDIIISDKIRLISVTLLQSNKESFKAQHKCGKEAYHDKQSGLISSPSQRLCCDLVRKHSCEQPAPCSYIFQSMFELGSLRLAIELGSLRLADELGSLRVADELGSLRLADELRLE